MVGAGPYSQLFEPLAWRFLTVLYRRHHRHLVGITEMHPGGGQYDVRALTTPDGEPVVLINLGASLSVKAVGGQGLHLNGPEVWARLASRQFGGLLDAVSSVLRWPADDGEPTAV